MRNKTYDVIVVGGGVMGSSIFAQLAQNGLTHTALIEKSSIGLAGSTAKSGGILRTYHQNSYLSDLAFESLPHFIEFEERYGSSCGFTQTGVAIFESYHRSEEVKKEVDRINQRLSVLEWKQGHDSNDPIFSTFSNSENDIVIYESRAGYANPIQTTQAWINYGKNHGLLVYEGVVVQDIVIQNGHVAGIMTSVGMIEAPVIVIAAGAWSKQLIERATGNTNGLRVKAIQMNAFTLPKGERVPLPFIDYTNELYGKQGNGFMIGLPVDKWDFDPDHEDYIDIKLVEQVKNCATKRFNWIPNADLIGGKRSFDAYTSDGLGSIGEESGIQGLFVCSGWSGGGFKVAPEVGRIMAEEIKSWLNKEK